ncbi:hypothetical protein A0J48_020585 [Sphaerospermopsis aphanizomenoides BCCUSP55]|uniref:hypothetical protein n=1 Tax=Sphaerospermopsis aphanizomenoides TaxID=459663 RepID=UPI001906D0EF|nr:hypothetical protein [Sphaerospermopsis aphanizomenoides]MBK1989897.1 hypothetical protein [Sphaerospermopsis aphanizomenoides BCCUSP55]
MTKIIEYKGVKIEIYFVFLKDRNMLNYRLLNAEGKEIEYLRGGHAVSLYKNIHESFLIRDAKLDIDGLIATGHINPSC